ncbi:MAG: hypothetical protein E5Y02_10230 [Mesorhizobium sp.]|nr:MAG: hypothetical protein E5Y02_10230 [Mesorhizobium sp.]
MAGQRPPLACRPSPPQVGRSTVVFAFAISNAGEETPRMKQPISPLEGEMSGRTEGGVQP